MDATLGKRPGPSTPVIAAISWKRDERSGEAARGGWSAASSSMTTRRAAIARALSVRTTMPGVGMRMHEAARVRSPSISTMQARQLPSLR